MEHVHLMEIPVAEGLRKNGDGRVLWCLAPTSVQGGPRATPAIYYLHARFVEPRILLHKDLIAHGLPPADPNVTPLLANMFRWSPIMPCEDGWLLLQSEVFTLLSAVSWRNTTLAKVHSSYYCDKIDKDLYERFAGVHQCSDLDWGGAEHHSIIQATKPYAVPTSKFGGTLCKPRHMSEFKSEPRLWHVPLGLVLAFGGPHDQPIPVYPKGVARAGIVSQEGVLFCSEAVINQIYPFIDPLHFSLYAYLAPKR